MVFTLILIFSLRIDWQGDDICYQYNYASGDTLPTTVKDVGGRSLLNSPLEIIPSQISHYKGINGRFPTHIIVQFFCAFGGQVIFAICNALAYIVLIFAILKLCKISATFGNILLTTLLVLIAFDTIYSPAYQINYVWASLINVLFLILYFNRNYSKGTRHSYLITTFAITMSVVAGMFNEALSVPIGGGLILDFVWRNYKRQYYSKWQWFLIIGYGIGGLFVCLSPGTLGRSTGVDLPYTILRVIKYPYLLYILIFVVLLTIAKAAIRRNLCNSLTEFYIRNSFYLNSLFIALSFNVIIGIKCQRQLVGIELMSILIIINELKRLNLSYLNYLLILFVGWQTYEKFETIKKWNDTYNELIEQYSLSEDGTVYIDMPMTIAGSHIDPIYKGTIYNQDNNSFKGIKYYLRDKLFPNESDKWLTIKPAYLKDFNDSIATNKVIKSSGDCWILIQNKKHPADFIIKQQYNFLNIRKFNLSPLKIDFVGDSILATKNHRIKVIYNNDELTRILSVKCCNNTEHVM